MHRSWEDLQTVKALVRTRSVATAGQELGLRHTTVSRRIAALEERLKTPLFLRGPRLLPTALARRIADGAQPMHAARLESTSTPPP